jgi:hypothetical protein
MVDVEHYDHNGDTTNIQVCCGFNDNGIIDYDPERILAILLLENQVFLNSYYYKSEWTEDAKQTISVNANCSDVFAWACADAEPVMYSELIDLFEHFLKDRVDGVSVWCIKKRNLMPQKPYYDAIMRNGKWDLDSMGLEPNRTWE